VHYIGMSASVVALECRFSRDLQALSEILLRAEFAAARAKQARLQEEFRRSGQPVLPVERTVENSPDVV
jgi:hypothetical protein